MATFFLIEHRIKKYRKHSLVPVIIRTFATAEVAKDKMPG